MNCIRRYATEMDFIWLKQMTNFKIFNSDKGE